MNNGKKDANNRMRRRIAFAAELLALAGVVAAAFFTPQALFYIKDAILYRDVELSRLERMDIEALSGNYETSMHQRMLNFAEGLAEGDSFYVTSKNLVVNEEVEEYLYSDTWYRIMDNLSFSDLIPYVLWDTGKWVAEWKQYVIYSDDYEKGVNFILWYMEVHCADAIILKILADGESGDLYALKLEGCRWVEQEESSFKYRELFSEDMLISLWIIYALYFEAYSSERDMLQQVAESLGISISNAGDTEAENDDYDEKLMDNFEIFIVNKMHNQIDEYDKMPEINEDMVREFFSGQLEWDYQENTASLWISYGSCRLELRLEIEEWQSGLPGQIYSYPDMLFGIRQIYELIPEFS